ncbi:transporter [Paenibacillus bovis]|uniref:Transporter n=1 Tax=Paenibacillus bovis TaxID=1616788 RepID=A0A172ZMD7_9BACL|nr:transporter [Paenibacillus bovis]
MPSDSFSIRSAGLSRQTVLLFAVACGVSVASIYYAHPLLDAFSLQFGIPASLLGMVITITQICYALGLFFLVPLGDRINRRGLIIVQMSLSVVSLLIVGLAQSEWMLFAGLGAVGMLAVVAQTLVAAAAHLSDSAERGRNVGLVTSGIVIGILLARTFAGIMTDLAGWRSVYLVSAVLLAVITGLLYRIFPTIQTPSSTVSYGHLLLSTLQLYRTSTLLRVRGLLALLVFGAFSTLWTALVLPLSQPPHNLSHTGIGALGIAGIAGALAAARAGKQADRGYGQRTTAIALLLLILSWIFISWIDHTLLALLTGIILLDLAVQAVHVTNQTMILTAHPDAGSRLTGAYMIFYSIGSATGSLASTQMYDHYGWTGVCVLGAVFSISAFIVWLVTRRYS